MSPSSGVPPGATCPLRPPVGASLVGVNTPKATASEGLAHGPYVAARVGLEPV